MYVKLASLFKKKNSVQKWTKFENSVKKMKKALLGRA